MKTLILFLVVLVTAQIVSSNEEASLPSGIWEEYMQQIDDLVKDPSYTGVLEEENDEYWKMMEEDEMNQYQGKFPCNNAEYIRDMEDNAQEWSMAEQQQQQQKEYKKPTSVHELTARDIAVIAALGDSITAANGANARFAAGVRTQYRGYSWSVGGEVSYEDGSTTIPNILKHYNPDLAGFSMGNGQADDYYASHMNVAIPGSIARDLPGQAVDLVKLFNEKGYTDEWKLITLFIGGNDLCRYCQHKEGLSPANHTMYITNTLDYLHQNLKNAFVNVVGIFDLTILGKIEIGLTCQILHPILCPCGIDPVEEELIRRISKEYNVGERELIDSKRYDDRDDFTVVYQPVMENMDIPRKKNGKADLTYMAPDCFHFSKKGHNSVAHFLWNNMWQPVGLKAHSMEYDVDIYCPAPGEFLKTAKNSADGWTASNKLGTSSEGESWMDSMFESSVFYLLGASGAILCITLLVILLILRKTPRRNADNSYKPLDTDEKLLTVEPEFITVAASNPQVHTYRNFDYLAVDEKTPMME